MVKEFTIKWIFSFYLMASNYFLISSLMKKHNMKEYFNKNLNLKKIVCLFSLLGLGVLFITVSYQHLEMSSFLFGIIFPFSEITFPYTFHKCNDKIRN